MSEHCLLRLETKHVEPDGKLGDPLCLGQACYHPKDFPASPLWTRWFEGYEGLSQGPCGKIVPKKTLSQSCSPSSLPLLAAHYPKSRIST